MEQLRELLERLQRGEVTSADVLAAVGANSTAATADAQVDVGRQLRCGFPEVVFCEGKSTAAIADIFRALQQQNQDCFGTRMSAEQAEALLQEFPEAMHNPTARTFRIPVGEPPPPAGKVAVITAGTSDRPVAEEAVETARWMGCEVELVVDVGVAGPHRLPQQMHRIADADAIVVVAGMEGALPSVVGGYVDCAVIAVPTSIGYGANFGGLTALLGMLNSCAANVTVVNIDSGFKGGYVAAMIARKVHAK